MIVGKAPVLQKAALAGPLGPVRRQFRAETTHPQRYGEGMEVWGFLEGGFDGGGVEPRLGELTADAARAMTAIGMAAQELASEARVVQQALFTELGDQLGEDGFGEALVGQAGLEIGGGVVTPTEQPQRCDARRARTGGGFGIGRAPSRRGPGRAAEGSAPQLSLSFSAPLPGLRAGSSFSRTCFSISSPSSGCSFRKLRVLSRPCPMRSPL
jgi:hypothetical protein